MKFKSIYLLFIYVFLSPVVVFGETVNAMETSKVVDNTKEVNKTPDNKAIGETKATVSQSISDAEKDKMINAYGWLIAKELSLASLNLSSKELDIFCTGLKLGCENGAPQIKSMEEMQKMQGFFEKRIAENADAVAKKNDEEFIKNKKEADAYVANLDKLPGIRKTESGLRYKILSNGDEKVRPTDYSQIVIEYEGKLIDGTVFDSSSNREGKAEIFIGSTVDGFKEGLQLIGKGGEIELYILPELGYMNRQLSLIPAGSLLIFKVKLLDILAMAPLGGMFDDWEENGEEIMDGSNKVNPEDNKDKAAQPVEL